MHSLILAESNPLEHVLPHNLHLNFWPGGINNQMFMGLVTAILMLVIFPVLFRRPDPNAPTGAKNFFESILEFLRIEVFRPALKEHTDRFVPFLWTLFFFILISNLLGQLPIPEIVAMITGKPTHFWGTATGNIRTTAALAICTFFFIHINGIAQVARSLIDGTYGHHGHHEEHTADGGKGHEAAHDLQHGRGDALAADVPGNLGALTNPTAHYADDEHGKHTLDRARHGHLDYSGTAAHNSAASAWLMAVPLYLWNFAPHPFKPTDGSKPSIGLWIADVFMWFVLLILELLGALIKPFALMVRLFANMIAGHTVLAALILLIPVSGSIAAHIGIGVPVTLMSLGIRMLELFVSFLQAYVFTFLATLFIASAVAPEH